MSIALNSSFDQVAVDPRCPYVLFPIKYPEVSPFSFMSETIRTDDGLALACLQDGTSLLLDS